MPNRHYGQPVATADVRRPDRAAVAVAEPAALAGPVVQPFRTTDRSADHVIPDRSADHVIPDLDADPAPYPWPD